MQRPHLRKYLFRWVNWISRHFFASRLNYAHIQAFLYNNSRKKFLNLIHVHWDMWRGKPFTNSRPYIFVFEITNVCNLKCPFCLTGKGISGGRDVRHMTFEEARNIIDAVADYTYFLQVYTWGEPLLNKDLVRIVEYAKQKNIYVMLSTNATAMTPAYNQRLIDSGIDYVMVAIDGGSDDTYKKYRVGGNFTRVLENVRNLLEQKRVRNLEHPFVEWQFIVFRHNEHEAKTTEEMAYRIGINKFTPLPAYVEDPEWAATDPEYRTQFTNPERLKDCDRPWSHLNVRADGGVASCCYSFFKKDDLGDLTKDRFAEIWNNAKFQQSRRLITQFKRGEEMEPSTLLCRDCLKTGVRPSFIETPTDTQTKQSTLSAAHGTSERQGVPLTSVKAV
ncbi:MAG: radical SAM/SPASM domain-containing protein [Chromatiales bacterium]